MSHTGSALAVIPTFQANERLLDLVNEVTSFCPVVISDDASRCTRDRLLQMVSKEHPSILLLRHRNNAGIARALNEALCLAAIEGHTWLLTLDQDTVMTADHMVALLESANRLEIESAIPVGVVAPGLVQVTQGHRLYTNLPSGQLVDVPEVIQSGGLWRVQSLHEIGGFDQRLSNDGVDAAACLQLRRLGHRVVLDTSVGMRHELGETRALSVLGRSVLVTGHSPARRETMIRNRFRLFPGEFRQSPAHALRTVRRVLVNQVLGLLVEQDRKSKALGTLRGFKPAKNHPR